MPPRINTALACNVSTKARLPVWRTWYPQTGDIGYLCAADAPAQLHLLLQTVAPSDGQRILLWSAGFQGQAACAVLEFRGS
jgi:3-oxoacyl-[acyl-carrier-protein] synthase III